MLDLPYKIQPLAICRERQHPIIDIIWLYEHSSSVVVTNVYVVFSGEIIAYFSTRTSGTTYASTVSMVN